MYMCARRVWCSEQITKILQNNYKIITNCNTIKLQKKYPIHYYPPQLGSNCDTPIHYYPPNWITIWYKKYIIWSQGCRRNECDDGAPMGWMPFGPFLKDCVIWSLADGCLYTEGGRNTPSPATGYCLEYLHFGRGGVGRYCLGYLIWGRGVIF